MLGDRQRRQIDVQPQPVARQVVPQTPTLTAKHGRTPAAQLLDLRRRESIQRARKGRLIGKLLAAPGAGQSHVGPQPTVDLRNRPTPGQQAHQHIDQLVLRPMVDRLQR